MNALSDLGIPRDIRHVSGNGVHTFRFINDNGQPQLFKWYWLPVLGYRSLVYDEATKSADKNNNFQRVDLYNNIEAGIYPEWKFAVQLFPDDRTFMWNGTDLIQLTKQLRQSTTTTEMDTCSHCSLKELQYSRLTASEMSKKPTFNRLSYIQGLVVKLQDPATLAVTSLAMTACRKPAHSRRHSTSMPAAHRGRISLRARACRKLQCHTKVH